MRPTFFVFLLSALTIFATAADSHSVPPPYVGVFSNESEGFYVKRLVLIEDGKCLYQGIPAMWKRDSKTDEFTITFPADAALEFQVFKLRFETAKREFTILDPKIAERSPPLHFIPAAIPDKIRKMLTRFDGTMKSYWE